MVGGTGNVTLSLSLLGRPVQTQPRSRMAQSHLQQMAILVLHEKNGWRGSAPRRLGTEPAFFLPGPLAGMYGKMRRDAQAWTQWHYPGTQHRQDKGSPLGMGVVVAKKAMFPRREAVCPPVSPGPQPLTARPCKGKISFYIGLISHQVPMDQHLLSFPRKQGKNHMWSLRYNVTGTVGSTEIFIACWEITLWFSLTLLLLFTFTLKYPGL